MYEQRPKMNCEWLNEQNMYDLLGKIQSRIVSNRHCILKILDDRYSALCIYDVDNLERPDCKTCIQQWMTRRRGT